MSARGHILDGAQDVDYEMDYFSWLVRQVHLLCFKQRDVVDLVNLAEEIEDMGRNTQHAIESIMRVIMWHLLKWHFQPQRRSKSWQLTLNEHRQRLQVAFAKNPSLRPYAQQILVDVYHSARRRATLETSLPLNTFPDTCPFGLEQVLDEHFLYL